MGLSIHLSAFLLASACVAGCATDATDDTSTSEAALSSSQKTAYNFFVSKGLSKDQAAGIVGNLIQESSVDPTAVEYGGGPGRGIAQWSVGGRWDSSHDDNVTWYASKHSLNRWALNTQLDFIWYELTTFGYGYSTLKGDSSVSSATVTFEDKYEICGECDQAKRIEYADQVLADFGGGGGGKGCYSDTLGRNMPDNACVQSKYDDLWYQCDNGDWVDRWTDPTACDGVHPL
jgi:hypothetical protein